MMKAYRVFEIKEMAGNKMLVKQARRFRKAKGLQLTNTYKDRALGCFLQGNEKDGYAEILAYVYLMTDGEKVFVVYEYPALLEGKAKADRIMWEDSSISEIIFK